MQMYKRPQQGTQSIQNPPFVRMDRKDLYPRRETKLELGRVVLRDGAEPVEVLSVDLVPPFKCCYKHKGRLCVVTEAGRASESAAESGSDLVELSPPRQLRPWKFDEIPSKNWFRRKCSPIAIPCGPVDASDNTVCIEGHWFSLQDLLLEYEHSPTHCGEFMPCGEYKD